MRPINAKTSGDRLYSVLLNTGTWLLQELKVYAQNEQEAIDFVADYVESHESYLCADHYALMDLCESNQTVDEYAEANNLTCAGNHGVYISVAGIEIIDGGNSNVAESY